MSNDKYIIDNYPLLAKIDSPEDLRRLDVAMLPAVCKELREFLIDQVSKNPGHFASSMGAVDLTVALHYVFATPHDRLVWDVGHQAYGHKILTGRRDEFKDNRKMGGLCGFPTPAESEYDTFAAGHASNSISAAIGMATAAKLEGVKRNVVAVIGDASISCGLAFEGLNNAANKNSNVIIVLNDNDMAIDQSVGSLGNYISKLHTSKRYNDLRFQTYNFLKHHGIISDKGRGAVMRFNNSVKALLNNQQNIFEGLNIRYFGPYDGHDVARLVEVFRDIKDMEGPRIVHLRTCKGKGYKPAEQNPTVWHAPGKFDKETGEIIKSYSPEAPLKYQDVFGKTLVELAKENPAIVGVTAAMPTGCSMTFMQEAFPDRAFDVGISEGHAVTFSGGMAKDGLRPFCCIYSTFLQRAYDNIIHDVALLNLPVTLCIDRGGLVGEDGATHHGAFDMAYLRCIPRMIVAAPRNEHWLRNMMFTAQSGDFGPFAIRYPRGSGKMVDWHNEMHQIEIGKGEKLCDGEKVAVLTVGPIGDDAAEVIEKLRGEGIKVAHYDMEFIKPLDGDLLKEVGENYDSVLTIEDGVVTGGFGTAVTDWLSEHDYMKRIRKIGIPDDFIHQGTVAQLYELCGMDKPNIEKTIRELFNK